MHVKNDIAQEFGHGRVVLLVLLDMSAAFDTIDHELLVNRLQTECGIKGCVLNWFNSYLRDRRSRVKISGSFSQVHPLKYGVPQ